MAKDFDTIHKRYTALKTEREKYKPLWDTISKYVGIAVDPDYTWVNNQGKKDQQLDEYIDDPTAAISVNQAGDYLIGIMWGTGDNAFKLVPSRYVLERDSLSNVEPFYDFASDQTLYHMNHSDAGFNNAIRTYAYDQVAFGTSGVGAFRNKDFINKTADNAFIFRQYGVDNICIDEGKNGMVEHVYATYQWRVNRIVGEFCMADGQVDENALSKLPREIRECWRKGDLNQEFTLVFGMFPRQDFDPKLKGKRGARYRGVWFMDKANDNKIFFEEDFAVKPIAVARMIKVRGETWGRSSGTMLISTIRAVNFMLATSIEIVEKMANPSLGIFNNAIFGDGVLDTSPNGLTVFNQALMGNNNTPAFPLFDVGDPSKLVQLIIPYLNEKVATAFKIDTLLDFASAKDMTATESMQRYAIRGKSLAGMLQQQKVELLEQLSKRCVSILWDMGELGVNPRTMQDAARRLKGLNKTERIIPESVIDVAESGRPWYEIKFNNELEKMTRTEAIQALVQVIQAVTGIASLFPQIIEAVDWYKLLKDVNSNLDANNQILLSETAFKKKLADIANQQRAAVAAQMGQAGAQIQKDVAQGNKANAEARNAV